METIKSLAKSISNHFERNAFYINEKFYSYYDLAKAVSKIRIAIKKNTDENDRNIGIIGNDDIETYAAIIAIWLEGKAFMPLSIDNPKSRNKIVIDQSNITTIIDTTETSIFIEWNIINPLRLPETEINLSPNNISNDEISILLFTSGTTGTPKGVPLTWAGITACMNDYWETGFNIENTDRCLQMFDLTFDFAIISFLAPILKGASIYTVPKNTSKFNYVFELLEDHKLTTIGVVPSFLQYLKPYFEEIELPDLKLCMIAGEALPLDLVETWSHCVPNAKIFNGFGLTETSIQCTNYVYKRHGNNKSHNGVLSIGKAQPNSSIVIADENYNILSVGIKGELCIGGPQITPGYWKDEERNKNAFVNIDYKGVPTRFYKTGDLGFMDEDGDIFYLGRMDFQAKIQGFRVELSEVEYHANTFLNKINTFALAIVNKFGNTDIGLAIESDEFETKELIDYLKTKMPSYMIPVHFNFINEFPLSPNGKTDRNKLTESFKI
ncbi:MAG: AMP-binding protein [Bacteroidales bacterium]|nr:AMP-binding protein [Bacteroidales bacterium]